jgi:DNA-binding NtrC family response regulator
MRTLQRARAAASTGADVLIEAESGTGKELLARFVHDSSDRSGKPFIAVNCAAVPEALLESELFGHGKGAFTGAIANRPGKFELADGGTILLDEIGEMPLNLQPKLLRVLQEREFERLGEGSTVHVDIRVIATTNVSLSAMVERGQFRADLYYRLNVIPLSLPPLRERREDIPVLARYFAEKYAAQQRSFPPRLHPDFLERLQSHSWPGNVRELANFMRRVLTLTDTSEIDARCFESEFQGNPSLARPAQASPAASVAPAGTPIWQVEKLHLEKTLVLTDGNRTVAAEMLGISLRTLRNKIREYGLPPRRYA